MKHIIFYILCKFSAFDAENDVLQGRIRLEAYKAFEWGVTLNEAEIWQSVCLAKYPLKWFEMDFDASRFRIQHR